MQKPRLPKHLLGAACLIVQPLLLNVIGMPATAYIIRVLGPTGYGQWSVSITLIGTVTFLANLGLRMLFVRAVAQEPEAAPRALAEQLGLRILLATLGGLVALSACALLHYPPVVLGCTVIAAAGLVFTVVGFAFADLLQGLESFPALAAANMTAGILLTAASVAAMRVEGGPVTLALAYLLGPVANAGLLYGIVRRRHFPVRISWDLRRFWELLKQSRLLAAQLFIANVGGNIEALLVPKLVGLAQYGYFSAGTIFASRLAIIPDGLNSAFFPVLARSHQEEGLAGTKRQVGRFLLQSFLLCLPVAIVTTLLAGPIAGLLFPKHAALCRDVMRITIWSLPLLSIHMVMGCALNAAGKEASVAKHSMPATLCGLVASVVLVSRFGVMGACWSWIARCALLLLFRLPCFFSTFSPPLSELPRQVVRRVLPTASGPGDS
jgi:O-antigen/teichoic acid export membrane protein